VIDRGDLEPSKPPRRLTLWAFYYGVTLALVSAAMWLAWWLSPDWFCITDGNEYTCDHPTTFGLLAVNFLLAWLTLILVALALVLAWLARRLLRICLRTRPQ
jgi:hypothetical protein